MEAPRPKRTAWLSEGRVHWLKPGMTCVMLTILMLAWVLLGAVVMVVVAALGRAGHLQDERRRRAAPQSAATPQRYAISA